MKKGETIQFEKVVRLMKSGNRVHGIRKIATFDEDFEKVDFLEVVKV